MPAAREPAPHGKPAPPDDAVSPTRQEPRLDIGRVTASVRERRPGRRHRAAVHCTFVDRDWREGRSCAHPASAARSRPASPTLPHVVGSARVRWPSRPPEKPEARTRAGCHGTERARGGPLPGGWVGGGKDGAGLKAPRDGGESLGRPLPMTRSSTTVNCCSAPSRISMARSSGCSVRWLRISEARTRYEHWPMPFRLPSFRRS
jgi:hypothetical protein